MEKELQEYNESLRGLLTAIRELRSQSEATKIAMDKAINGSHLRSLLTLHSEDFLFRRVMENGYV